MDVEINVEGEMNDEEANESEISVRPPTPPRRNLGHFKTPQLPMRIARGMSRASLGGAPPQATPNFIAPSVGPFEGPRRVRVDPAWKVHDIKVDNGSDQAILEPMISRTVQEGVVAAPSPMRPKLSEQEREVWQHDENVHFSDLNHFHIGYSRASPFRSRGSRSFVRQRSSRHPSPICHRSRRFLTCIAFQAIASVSVQICAAPLCLYTPARNVGRGRRRRYA